MAEDASEHRGPGRPPVVIDEHLLLQMAQAHFTLEEVAAVMKISERTVIRKLKESPLKEIWEQGKAMGRASLRRLQWKHAQMTNSAGVTMSIHLSKHWLGETEKAALEVTGRIDSAIEVSVRDRLSSKLEALNKRISSRVDGIAVEAGASPTPVGTD